MFEVTTAWKSAFPGAHAGVLVIKDVSNPAQHPELEKWKGELEAELRSQFRRAGTAPHCQVILFCKHTTITTSAFR